MLSLRSKIGRGAIVGEGAVVIMGQSVPEGVVVVGNPAKVIRNVEERDIKHWSYGKQLYIDLAKKYLQIGMHVVSEGTVIK